jgi:hypothetical protein
VNIIFELWEFVLYADVVALVSGATGDGSKSYACDYVVTRGAETDAFMLGFGVTGIPRGEPVKIRPSFCTHERSRKLQNVLS